MHASIQYRLARLLDACLGLKFDKVTVGSASCAVCKQVASLCWLLDGEPSLKGGCSELAFHICCKQKLWERQLHPYLMKGLKWESWTHIHIHIYVYVKWYACFCTCLHICLCIYTYMHFPKASFSFHCVGRKQFSSFFNCVIEMDIYVQEWWRCGCLLGTPSTEYMKSALYINTFLKQIS